MSRMTDFDAYSPSMRRWNTRYGAVEVRTAWDLHVVFKVALWCLLEPLDRWPDEPPLRELAIVSAGFLAMTLIVCMLWGSTAEETVAALAVCAAYLGVIWFFVRRRVLDPYDD